MRCTSILRKMAYVPLPHAVRICTVLQNMFKVFFILNGMVSLASVAFETISYLRSAILESAHIGMERGGGGSSSLASSSSSEILSSSSSSSSSSYPASKATWHCALFHCRVRVHSSNPSMESSSAIPQGPTEYCTTTV